MSDRLVEMVFDSQRLRERRRRLAEGYRKAGFQAVRQTARELEKAYEDATKSASLGRLSRVWASEAYDQANPAAIVYPKGGERTRKALRAYGYGAKVSAQSGKLLWFTTGFNKAFGRRNADTAARVPLAEMATIDGAFVIDAKTGTGAKIWCLPVVEAQKRSINTGRITRLAFAAGRNDLQVGTSRKKGAGLRARQLLKQGFVPMFIGIPQFEVDQRYQAADIRRPYPAKLRANFLRLASQVARS